MPFAHGRSCEDRIVTIKDMGKVYFLHCKFAGKVYFCKQIYRSAITNPIRI